MMPEQKAEILEILDGAKDITVATMRQDGYPQANSRSMTAKFPQISDYATEEDSQQVRIVRVEPEVLSLLDYRKGFGHTEAIARSFE